MSRFCFASNSGAICAPAGSPWNLRSRPRRRSRRIGAAADASLILILSDINMPGMSGLELLPKAKAARPDVPIIMITAYGDAETKRKALEGGAEALLTKPIDFGAVAQRDRNAGRKGRMTARSCSSMTSPISRRWSCRNSAARSATGRSSFLFARDGVEALGGAEGERRHRSRRHRHQYAADGRPDAAAEAAGKRGAGYRPSSCRPMATWPISAPR